MVDAAALCVAGEGLDIHLCCGTLPGRLCTWKYSPSFLRGRSGAGEKIKCAHTVFHFPFTTHSVLIHLLCRFSFPSLLPNLVLLFGRNQITGLSSPQFLFLYPTSSSSASPACSIICHTIFVTHHSHNILSPTFHTPFLSHGTFYTQSFSNSTSHTTYFVTHTIVYTQLSHLLCFTHHLCHR